MNLQTLKETPPWDWPENAGETLGRILRDRRASAADRLVAAELGGDPVVVNDEIAGLLLEIAQSSDEADELRAQAAISLGPVLEEADMGGYDDEISEPPIEWKMFQRIKITLRGICEDEGVSKIVRRRALEASVRAPEDWHSEAIEAAYASGDEDWKLTAAFCMRWVGGFEAQILELLKSGNPEIEYEAVLAAGDAELEEAWPHVHGLLTGKTTERELLLAAIEAAGGIGGEEANHDLMELAESEDEEIAEAANEALETRAFKQGVEEDEDNPYF